MTDTIIGVDPISFGEAQDELNEQNVVIWLLQNKPVPLQFFDKNAADNLTIINCTLDEVKQVIVGDIVDNQGTKTGEFAVGILPNQN